MKPVVIIGTIGSVLFLWVNLYVKSKLESYNRTVLFTVGMTLSFAMIIAAIVIVTTGS